MILLSLVGEQPIPNLLPLWQFGELTGIRFAVSDKTFAQGESLLHAVAGDEPLKRLRRGPLLVLDAYDLGKARQALVVAISDMQAEGEKVWINFTGGTKIMGAAALQAAYGSGATLMYVSTELGQVIFYQSDGVEIRRVALNVSVSVGQYLQACGLEVLPANPHVEAPPKEGDPLEQQVYAAACQAGIFDDVQRGVKVRRLTNGKEVCNELDVVVTRNGRLAVCSCKSGRNIADAKQALYELAALSARESLGIYCGKVLALAMEEPGKALFDRASASHIELVGGKQLTNIAYYLHKATN